MCHSEVRRSSQISSDKALYTIQAPFQNHPRVLLKTPFVTCPCVLHSISFKWLYLLFGKVSETWKVYKHPGSAAYVQTNAKQLFELSIPNTWPILLAVGNSNFKLSPEKGQDGDGKWIKCPFQCPVIGLCVQYFKHTTFQKHKDKKIPAFENDKNSLFIGI